MSTLPDWPGLWQHANIGDLIRSAIWLVLLVFVRTSILRTISANPNVALEVRRRWTVGLRNGLFLLGMVGLIVIWASQLEAIAVSMVALAAALVVATKELIMCAGGSLLRSVSNCYDLGDHIEVSHYRGRVVDINLLSTTIMEIGPRHDSHQITGRAIAFPNSLLLANPVIKENYMGHYVIHIITVPMAYAIPPARAERLLKAAADQACLPHVEDARQHMERMAARHLLDIPSVEPRIAVQPVDDKRYQLILRVAIPAKERQRIEQAILHQFMDACFPETNNPA
ncbi:mechanosensitive ion channel family protein [Paludibacterium denitrificans]|uniref:Mechanosensitive ion channel n=1 Tax=Paludibacterium denitrificans TaxID=2675226 RepID=A0A844GDT9_9NEIS|nr:mechanosensitive ion channel family protein [Paludibacterium denitrificans]MTD33819.1 mechanosensitive ion channel [Paludibacterium denitrificans]